MFFLHILTFEERFRLESMHLAAVISKTDPLNFGRCAAPKVTAHFLMKSPEAMSHNLAFIAGYQNPTDDVNAALLKDDHPMIRIQAFRGLRV